MRLVSKWQKKNESQEADREETYVCAGLTERKIDMERV